MMKPTVIFIFLASTFLFNLCSYADICDRSPAVQEAIIGALNRTTQKGCSRISDKDLYDIQSINLSSSKGRQLTRADFKDLKNLKVINFHVGFNNPNFEFPNDVFQDLSLLTKASYDGKGTGLLILTAATNLEELKIMLDSGRFYEDGSQKNDPALYRIQGSDFLKLKKLKSFEMDSRVIDSRSYPYELVSLPFDECSSLKTLSLSKIKIGANIDLLGEASRIGKCHANFQPILKSLFLNNLHSTDILKSDNISPNSSITDLSIYYGIVPDFNQFIANFSALTNLTIYPSSGFSLRQDRNIDISNHPSLESIKLGLFTSENVSYLVFANLPMLKRISPTSFPLESFLGSVNLINLPNLTSFVLSNDLFTVSCSHISFRGVNWNQNINLKRLGLKSIPKFYEMENVKVLNLEGNGITNIPLDYASTLPKDLEELNLCGNNLVNPQSYWNLVQGYPQGAVFKIKVTTGNGCEYLNKQ